MSAAIKLVAPPIAPERVKPLARGKSGFFSWHLYEWLKRHPEHTRIYRGNVHYPGAIYIGKQDGRFLHGALLEVVAKKGQTLDCWAFVDKDKTKWVDITEEFWAEYQSKGVCAIFTDGSAHVYSVADDSRECLYCGVKKPLVHRRVTNRANSGLVLQ